MDPHALAAALQRCVAAGPVPMAVVSTAGTTDFGAIDQLGLLGALCRDHSAWLHVDAASRGGLLASTRSRHLLDVIVLDASVTLDDHQNWFTQIPASPRNVGQLRRAD